MKDIKDYAADAEVTYTLNIHVGDSLVLASKSTSSNRIIEELGRAERHNLVMKEIEEQYHNERAEQYDNYVDELAHQQGIA